MIDYVNDSFASYLSKKDHISSSDIKNFLRSPKYYYWKKYVEKQPEEKRHFVVGTAFHCLLLEPKKFDSRFCYMLRDIDLRTKDGKAERDRFKNSRQNKKKTLLSLDEYTMIKGMSESATNNKTFIRLVDKAYRELSVYTVDKKTGLKVKLRPDSYSKKLSVITDIKTAADVSVKRFKYDALDYGYNISAPYYMDFTSKDHYLFAAFGKSEPYEFAIYELSADLIERGRKLYRTALDLLSWSYENNYWCDAPEFELLKTCHETNDLKSFFKLKETADLIQTIK